MSVDGYPGTLDFINYKNTETLDGNSGSVFTMVCGVEDMEAVRALFLEAVDGNDPNLHCSSFDFTIFGDSATDMYLCEARFIPTWKLTLLQPDQPFRVYINSSSMDMTLKSSDWTWASGAPVTNQVSPIMTIGIQEVVLKGARTGVDLSTYGGYADKVNSDTFLGKDAGLVIFKSASISPRQLATGIITNDVEIRLESRNIPWNQFFNEDTGLFEEVRDPSSNPMFASAAFSGLLT